MTTLINGTGKVVGMSNSAIKEAILGDTSIVSVKGNDDVNISYFNSDLGDEVVVSDGHNTENYDVDTEMNEAINSFMKICEQD